MVNDFSLSRGRESGRKKSSRVFDAFRDKSSVEFKRLSRSDLEQLPSWARSEEGYAKYKFQNHQTKMLGLVTRKGYLDSFRETGNVNIHLRGSPRKLTPNRYTSLRRAAIAPLYGYGIDDTQVIAEGAADLTSNNHWKKVRTIRWLKVYDYCTRRTGLDFKNMDHWAEAATRIDQESGNLTIWDVLTDTEK